MVMLLNSRFSAGEEVQSRISSLVLLAIRRHLSGAFPRALSGFAFALGLGRAWLAASAARAIIASLAMHSCIYIIICIYIYIFIKFVAFSGAITIWFNFF